MALPQAAPQQPPTSAPTPGAQGTSSAPPAAPKATPAPPAAATGTQTPPQPAQSTQPQPKGEKTAPTSTTEQKAEPVDEELAKLGLADEQQQAVASYAAKVVEKATEAQRKEWEDTIATWNETVTKDKELGGRNAQETVRRVDRALLTYGAEARQVLADSMLLAHPEVIRMLSRIGAALTEDNQGGSATPKSNALSKAEFYKELYGDPPKTAD